jgi:hypothetical protein
MISSRTEGNIRGYVDDYVNGLDELVAQVLAWKGVRGLGVSCLRGICCRSCSIYIVELLYVTNPYFVLPLLCFILPRLLTPLQFFYASAAHAARLASIIAGLAASRYILVSIDYRCSCCTAPSSLSSTDAMPWGLDMRYLICVHLFACSYVVIPSGWSALRISVPY